MCTPRWMTIRTRCAASNKRSNWIPTMDRAHHFAGVALVRLGRPSEAIPQFEAELKLSPDDPDTQYNLAYALLETSQKDQAMAILQKLIAAHPDHAQAQYELGKELLSSETRTKRSYTWKRQPGLIPTLTTSITNCKRPTEKPGGPPMPTRNCKCIARLRTSSAKRVPRKLSPSSSGISHSRKRHSAFGYFGLRVPMRT